MYVDLAYKNGHSKPTVHQFFVKENVTVSSRTQTFFYYKKFKLHQPISLIIFKPQSLIIIYPKTSIYLSSKLVFKKLSQISFPKMSCNYSVYCLLHDSFSNYWFFEHFPNLDLETFVLKTTIFGCGIHKTKAIQIQIQREKHLSKTQSRYIHQQ